MREDQRIKVPSRSALKWPIHFQHHPQLIQMRRTPKSQVSRRLLDFLLGGGGDAAILALDHLLHQLLLPRNLQEVPDLALQLCYQLLPRIFVPLVLSGVLVYSQRTEEV